MTKETPSPSDDETDSGHSRRKLRELAERTSAPGYRPALPHPSLFELGRVVATPGAIELLAQTHTDAATLLNRHRCGDWGTVGAHDANANEHALQAGDRILSAYELGNARERLWIITESDRSATTLLLPAEY